MIEETDSFIRFSSVVTGCVLYQWFRKKRMKNKTKLVLMYYENLLTLIYIEFWYRDVWDIYHVIIFFQTSPISFSYQDLSLRKLSPHLGILMFFLPGGLFWTLHRFIPRNYTHARYTFTGCIKLEKFWPKNQHIQRKILNFENWTNGEPQWLAKIRVFKVYYFDFSCKKIEKLVWIRC